MIPKPPQNTEIERKFLVDKGLWSRSKERENAQKYTILQGYLCSQPHSTVRVRIKNEIAFLTIKSATIGITRSEYEYEIPRRDAQEMLEKMCTGTIEKTRFVFSFDGYIWEIDEFHGIQSPLIMAEVELPSEDSAPNRPGFIREEVSSDHRYSNSQLSMHPYSKW